MKSRRATAEAFSVSGESQNSGLMVRIRATNASSG
jgi:hypothetical protein